MAENGVDIQLETIQNQYGEKIFIKSLMTEEEKSIKKFMYPLSVGNYKNFVFEVFLCEEIQDASLEIELLEINNFGTYLIYIVVFCVCPAIFEEVMFRGTILSGLKQYGLKVAVVVSAIIFTLMHGNIEQTVHQFIIGLVVGFIFFKTGNLWLSVMVHFFNNFILYCPLIYNPSIFAIRKYFLFNICYK